MHCNRLIFTRHALQRMFARGIPEAAIAETLRSGETIEVYPQDQPYPSILQLGWYLESPLHVVAAQDSQTGDCIVISAYIPDTDRWVEDFRTRKRP
ncbi:DUF4258 domain-containing protein [Acidithiobacillus sp. CV18-2]|nr:DUF4258 domain-containing protein [Acidithiobacillus sp. CV18-3]MBU2756914.1 DUF4258 domain-containing protein [Acidithiobacillus sp. BN09-2]MBU2777988.1 DUF4258 domain-containing protein [Acidithiobacillus sp. CV18-2]MBU2799625.1 DUF4258 domain-containing protein [Acidithiobacillus sp. VAN18-4]